MWPTAFCRLSSYKLKDPKVAIKNKNVRAALFLAADFLAGWAEHALIQFICHLASKR
jgi:predicted metal-binding membrane protein